MDISYLNSRLNSVCEECEMYGSPPVITLQYKLPLPNPRIHGSTLQASCDERGDSIVIDRILECTLRLPPVMGSEKTDAEKEVERIVSSLPAPRSQVEWWMQESEVEDIFSPHIEITDMSPENVISCIQLVNNQYDSFKFTILSDSRITE